MQLVFIPLVSLLLYVLSDLLSALKVNSYVVEGGEIKTVPFSTGVLGPSV